MIAVTGSTGQLGHLVIEALLKKVPAKEIVAFARDISKAKTFADKGVQVRKGDYDDPASWESALNGVTKLLLISSNDLAKRQAQHRAVIEAAKRAGVSLIAYTSTLHADKSVLRLAEDHRKTEADLKMSGVPYVLLRNGWYTENHTAGIKEAIKHGVLFGAAADGRISSATREQYAIAAAVVLTSKENQAGRIFELAGDTFYTLADLAREISKKAGKEIAYNNLSEAQYKDFLIKAGLPEAVASLISDSDAGAAENALYDESHQLSKLIGEKTETMAQTVAASS